jgi:hypothetical protein
LYVHWTCESRFHTTHWKVAECSSHSYKCPKSIKLQNNSRPKHHIERHNQYATDICPHLVVTSQLQEKIDSTGHPFNTTDPLKFDSIGKQKVNSIRIIENARTSATEVLPNKRNTQIIDNYAMSRSLRHILSSTHFPV